MDVQWHPSTLHLNFASQWTILYNVDHGLLAWPDAVQGSRGPQQNVPLVILNNGIVTLVFYDLYLFGRIE